MRYRPVWKISDRDVKIWKESKKRVPHKELAYRHDISQSRVNQIVSRCDRILLLALELRRPNSNGDRWEYHNLIDGIWFDFGPGQEFTSLRFEKPPQMGTAQ